MSVHGWQVGVAAASCVAIVLLRQQPSVHVVQYVLQLPLPGGQCQTSSERWRGPVTAGVGS